jgi:hypothetical protein
MTRGSRRELMFENISPTAFMQMKFRGNSEENAIRRIQLPELESASKSMVIACREFVGHVNFLANR